MKNYRNTDYLIALLVTHITQTLGLRGKVGTTLGVWIVSTKRCAKNRTLMNVWSSSTHMRESVENHEHYGVMDMPDSEHYRKYRDWVFVSMCD